jgi:hypothetical protein
LDFVVEVRLLEQLTQIAGAQLRGKRLFLVVFEIMIVGLAVMVMGSVEFLFFDDLFFNQAGAGRIGGDGGWQSW